MSKVLFFKKAIFGFPGTHARESWKMWKIGTYSYTVLSFFYTL